MNKIQATYNTAQETYWNYLNTCNDWNEEIDEQLYDELEAAKTELLEWAFNKALKVAFISEAGLLNELYQAYKNRTMAWIRKEDEVIELAMRLQ